VESSVEDRDLWDSGQRLACVPDLLECPAIVERGESRELVDRALDLLVDEHRAVEVPPAVDDTVAHGVRRDEALHGTGFVSVNEVKLEARGAGIDDKDVHRTAHRRGFS